MTFIFFSHDLVPLAEKMAQISYFDLIKDDNA